MAQADTDDIASTARRALPVASLTKAQARLELAALATEIAHHDRRYHQKDAPKISDAAYDALVRRHAAIEARFPAAPRAKSPSARVGAAPAARFRKVPHTVPMLSLGNTVQDEEVHGFAARVRRVLGLTAAAPLDFVAEPKIDGEPPRLIPCRLKTRLRGGTVTWQIEIADAQRMIDRAIVAAADRVELATGITMLRGLPIGARTVEAVTAEPLQVEAIADRLPKPPTKR